jgi:hypothetical protein
VLEVLQEEAPNVFHYGSKFCHQRFKKAHERNVCWRDVINSWNLTYGKRQSHGICLLPSELIAVNKHRDSPGNEDWWLHGKEFDHMEPWRRKFYNVTREAPLFHGQHCPWANVSSYEVRSHVFNCSIHGNCNWTLPPLHGKTKVLCSLRECKPL